MFLLPVALFFAIIAFVGFLTINYGKEMTKYVIQSEVIGYKYDDSGLFPTEVEARIYGFKDGAMTPIITEVSKHYVEINGNRFEAEMKEEVIGYKYDDSGLFPTEVEARIYGFKDGAMTPIVEKVSNVYAEIASLGIRALVQEEVIGYKYGGELFSTSEEARIYGFKDGAMTPIVEKVSNVYAEIDACNDELVTNCISVGNDLHSSDL
jgi:hypothetical protein